LVKKNLDAKSTRQLILELQQLAKDSGHEYPLLIAIDQENGMLNSLCDKHYLTQFPGNMAIVATKSKTMATQVAEATGRELKAVGINWILGPVVDVLTNSASKLLGVRSMGDDPDEVTEYALAFLEGFRRAGIATCGKHFPGYGNATINTTLGLPVIQDSLDQLKTASLIPFRGIIEKNIDSIMVGGCALPKVTLRETYACLSEEVVRGLLRDQMGYKGVVVSECLEMQYLYDTVGVSQGAMMAALAGCDVIIICTQYRLQIQALFGILAGLRNGVLPVELVRKSAHRLREMKHGHLSWNEALNPPPLSALAQLRENHTNLALQAYEQAITLLRDQENLIPLNKSIDEGSNILLLTPHIIPISGYTDGDIFSIFGKALIKYHSGRLQHTTYTEKGLIDEHHALVSKAKAIILITTDANRNEYQISFTKVIAALCNQHRLPLVCIAGSSPYDMALDRTIGTYLCIYEFTEACLKTTAKVLFGRLPAVGRFPGSGQYQNQLTPFSSSSRRRWLVEEWSPDQPGAIESFRKLWENCFPERNGRFQFDLFASVLSAKHQPAQKHFFVKNSSTNKMYGFCGTWVHPAQHTGSIIMLFVDPARRRMAIGKSLHERALKYLASLPKLDRITLGARLPGFFAGIPLSPRPSPNEVDVVKWFKHSGWDIPHARKNSPELLVHTMALSRLSRWRCPEAVMARLTNTNVTFEVMGSVQPSSKTSLSPTSFGSSPVSSGFAHKLYKFLSSFEALPSGIPELYRLALSDVAENVIATSGSNNDSNATIVAAIDTESGEVIASLVSFKRKARALIRLQPWIFEFSDACGLCALLGWTPLLRQALVAFQLEHQRQQKDVDLCALYGVDSGEDKWLMQQLGFEETQSFLTVQRSVTRGSG
jgi:beta-N-acetylhexosaminidase